MCVPARRARRPSGPAPASSPMEMVAHRRVYICRWAGERDMVLGV